jgi:GH15 family glucan-1,4-alpha-glucosidase
VRDFMPVITGKAAERHRLVRVLTVPRGTMRFAMDLQPRFDYGRQAHTLTISDRGAMFEEEGSGGMRLTLHTVGQGGAGNGDGEGVQVCNQGDGLQATWTLGQGEATGVVLESMGGQPRRLAPSELARMFDTTSLFWHNWLNRPTCTGRWREIVSRSAVTLKLMTYAPTGAPVAAPTAGLPGQIGGERNWDYRYT